MAEIENGIQTGGEYVQPAPGSAGLNTQMPGQATTVSAAAGATGGIGGDNFIQPDIDQELFKYCSNDTPLMQVALKLKKRKVTSPQVRHYAIDEPRSQAKTTADMAGGQPRGTLQLEGKDQQLFQEWYTIVALGVNGYDNTGENETPGKDLMMLVVDVDGQSGNPVVVALNGPKGNPEDETCNMPAIPAGTTLVLLSTACYETQKEVPPSMIVPQPTDVYCQKRIMNQVISDYFDATKKAIPFQKALIAEAMLQDFYRKTNRSYWAGVKSKISVRTKLGVQTVLTSEGLRYQMRKEIQKSGAWSVDDLIALSKMAYTGEDVPENMTLFAGKNLVESLQKIDFSKHPNIHIQMAQVKELGWEVSRISFTFGSIDIKYEPTLDRLGWANSGALIATDRLVRYVFSNEHKANDKVDGHEATREALITWDCLALKGSCHIWINGEGDSGLGNGVSFTLHNGAEAPTEPVEGMVYYLGDDCPGINKDAMSGQMWQCKDGKWTEYDGTINV